MKLVDVDALQSQVLKAAFDGLLRGAPGSGIVLPNARPVARPARLGRDDQASGIRPQRFGDQFLRDIGAVGIGSVNKVDSQLDSAAKRGQSSIYIVGQSPDTFCP